MRFWAGPVTGSHLPCERCVTAAGWREIPGTMGAMHNPEPLEDLARIIDRGGAHFETRTLGEVACQGLRLPLQVVTLGNPDPAVPAVGFFGGVHGL